MQVLIRLASSHFSLGDSDDDVRSVAASCLLPITRRFVEQLPEDLPRVLAILWMCLGDMKDDLSSSVGAVMDLLGVYFSVNTCRLTRLTYIVWSTGLLVGYDQVIQTLANSDTS